MKKIYLIPSIFIILMSCSYSPLYEISDDKVYFNTWDEGNGSQQHLIEEADVATFQILNNKRYAKDKNYAYYRGQRIEGAEPDSFVSVDDFYAKDKNHAYYGDRIITNAAPDSFEVVSGNYTKDNIDYYYMTKELNVCDMDSFQIRDEHFDWWSNDKCSYYYQGMKVPIRDLSTFEILGGGFSKDKYEVYYGYEIFDEDVDPATFEMIGDTYCAKDKNGCYNLTGKIDCPKPSIIDSLFGWLF